MTPVGDFKINDRIAQPTWWRGDGRAIPYGDKENLLGTHWLSLDIRGYGIHGTWEPDTIGKQASAGCVRMLNEEVEELYNLIPLGTTVTITD
jgi:lipoprotein-anchoring transpeptidase ErfK/SrfK